MILRPRRRLMAGDMVGAVTSPGRKILLKQIRRRVSRAVFSRVLVDAGGDLRNVVFLAGAGRSGTTWVSHLINYRNQYRYIFEPFPSDKTRVWDVFKDRHYIRPETNDRALLAAAAAILSGRFRNGWIDRYNRRLVSRRRLIKDVRANLLLKWLHVHFPEVRIILLLRHPCAVASSRAKLRWPPCLDEFLTQTELIGDFLHPFKEAIEQARTDFEKHIFAWCIENYVPLNQLRNGEVHVAFYEHFCVRPGEEITKMFSFLGESFDDRVFQEWPVPVLARKDGALFSGGSLVDGWRKHVSAVELKRACEIVRLFSLDRIYSDESFPHVAGAICLPGPHATGEGRR